MFERSVFHYEGLEVRVSDHANEGILDILQENNIIGDVIDNVKSGFVEIPICKLLV